MEQMMIFDFIDNDVFQDSYRFHGMTIQEIVSRVEEATGLKFKQDSHFEWRYIARLKKMDFSLSLGAFDFGDHEVFIDVDWDHRTEHFGGGIPSGSLEDVIDTIKHWMRFAA